MRTPATGAPEWLARRQLKILDYVIAAEGNQLDLFLGDPSLRDWWGDDWDDRPYELNGGIVYREFVSNTLRLDISTVLVTEAYQLAGPDSSRWSKEDLKSGRAPILTMSFDLDHEVLVYIGEVIDVPAGGPLPLIDIPFALSPGRTLPW